jgi:hypothetical protein
MQAPIAMVFRTPPVCVKTAWYDIRPLTTDPNNRSRGQATFSLLAVLIPSINYIHQATGDVEVADLADLADEKLNQ